MSAMIGCPTAKKVGYGAWVRPWDYLAGPPRERFARRALRIASRSPGVLRATYDREKFAIALHPTGGGAAPLLYLSNVFHETAGSTRGHQAEQLRRLVRLMTSPAPIDGWESVRGSLRPVLRQQTFGQGGPPGMPPVLARPVLPYLHELVVVDQPETMAYVASDRLADWGVTAGEVFDAARANLSEIAERSLAQRWATADAMVSMIDDGNGYFTSLLLAPGWLAGVAERMGGPVLAFAPDTRTVLLCALPEDARPLYDMVEKAYREEARSLSPVGYVAGASGDTVAYTPAPGHPHEVAARRAEVVLAATEYGAQQAWLEREFKQAGIDVHVGALLAVAPPDGPALTVATWTDNITSLLPAAHSISFVRDGQVAFRVPWHAVAQHVDLQPEPLLAPARFKVGGWPPPEVMKLLAADAVD